MNAVGGPATGRTVPLLSGNWGGRRQKQQLCLVSSPRVLPASKNCHSEGLPFIETNFTSSAFKETGILSAFLKKILNTDPCICMSFCPFATLTKGPGFGLLWLSFSIRIWVSFFWATQKLPGFLGFPLNPRNQQHGRHPSKPTRNKPWPWGSRSPWCDSPSSQRPPGPRTPAPPDVDAANRWHQPAARGKPE